MRLGAGDGADRDKWEGGGQGVSVYNKKYRREDRARVVSGQSVEFGGYRSINIEYGQRVDAGGRTVINQATYISYNNTNHTNNINIRCCWATINFP